MWFPSVPCPHGEGTRARAGRAAVPGRPEISPEPAACFGSAAVRGEHLRHPGALPGGEHAVAGVVGVVHVVADRVQTRQRAGVTTDRAAARGTALCRGVGHLVVLRGAAALEGVVEAEPVPGL